MGSTKGNLQNVNQEIIEQIIKARMDQRLTQAELAKRMNIPQSNISRLESGRYNPTLEFLNKVAVALNMELEVVLRDKNRLKAETSEE